MLSRNRAAAGVLALLALAAACDNDAAAPADDRADVVMAVASLSMTLRSGTLGENQSYTQSCPDGGRLVVEGSDTFRSGQDGYTSLWDQTLRQEACAMTVNSRRVVADGEMHVFGEARFIDDGDESLLLVMQESGQKGTMTTTVAGDSRTCDLDLTHRFDPDARTYHITGAACGRTIDMYATLPGP